MRQKKPCRTFFSLFVTLCFVMNTAGASAFAADRASTLEKEVEDIPFSEQFKKTQKKTSFEKKKTTKIEPNVSNSAARKSDKKDGGTKTSKQSQKISDNQTIKEEDKPYIYTSPAELLKPVPVPTVKNLNEPKYNFDWQGTSLSHSLYAIAKISGKKMLLNGDIAGTVYTSLDQVTFDEALDYLSKVFNFNWMIEDDAILISKSDMMLQTKRFDVRFADKNKIKDELKALNIEEKNIYVNSEYGSVSVTGTPYQITQAKRLIAQLDQPVSQVLIVAQMIEVSHGKNLDLGMKYSLPTYAHTGSDESDANSLKGNFIEKLTFSASSEANKAMARGKVIARPMILTQNGQEASVFMGDSVPVPQTTSTTNSTEVTFEYQDVGSSLKVTPVIDMASGNVSMTLETEIKNISKYVQQGNMSAPQISSRKATTVAHLRSGQSFVIGGLMTSKDLDNLSGIPGLMDLPILGKLFSYHSASKENTEVFIMITPYIVQDGVDPQKILRSQKEG